jgi:hypothetical protein
MKLKTIGYAVAIAATAAFAIGASAPSFAAKKKKAEPAPTPAVCFDIYKPVCGARGGMTFTYANSCYAAKDGAKVVAQGACKPHKAHKKMAKPAMKKDAKPAMKKDDMKKPMDKK